MPEAQRRFYAIKLFERDDKIGAQMTMVPDVGSITARMEEAMDDDAESIITNERYTTLHPLLGCYTKRAERR